MPKDDADTQYHVSLVAPMRIKMAGHIVEIVAFDGVMSYDGPAIPDVLAFATDCVYGDVNGGLIARARRAIRTQFLVPIHNIAGMVPQPFEKRA